MNHGPVVDADATLPEVTEMLTRARTAAAELGHSTGPTSDGWALDVDGLLEGYASGAIDVGAVVDACLERTEQIGRQLGTVWAIDEVGALAAAERSQARWKAGCARPLEGVPIVVKDLLDTAGLTTTGGSQWLRGRTPTVDAAVVQAVRHAGAVVIAKTATFEFGCGDEAIPFGVVRNPWNPERTTGGSSAGSAAALAARCAPLALGTDTGGSIRIPSAYCATVGLKPTLGRLPCAGLLDLAPTLDTPGPMARTVSDTARLFAALSGTGYNPTPRPLAELRLGRATNWFDEVLTDDVRHVFGGAVEALAADGAQITDVHVPGAEHGAPLSWMITMYEAAQTYGNAPREQLTQAFAARLTIGGQIPRRDYLASLRSRRRLAAAVATAFAGIDALVIPGCVSTAPAHDDLLRPVAGVAVNWPDVTARTMAIWNVIGFPSVALPIGFGTDGLPIGMQVVGPPHSDETCLAIAATIEGSQPIPHWPDLSSPLTLVAS